MEGSLAVLGFWCFVIALVMKKPLMALIEKSKAEGASNAQLQQRMVQLESISQTMAKDLLEIKQILQSQTTSAELNKLKADLQDGVGDSNGDAQSKPVLIETRENGSERSEGSDDLGVIVDKDTIRFERLLPGTVGDVWKYFSDANFINQWLASANIEARAGSRIELNFAETAGGEFAGSARVRGLITVVDAPRTINYSWMDAQTALQSNVSFELFSEGENTKLVLTHKRLPDNKLADFLAAWHVRLDVLIAKLRKAIAPEFAQSLQKMLPIYSALVLTTFSSVAPANAALSEENYQTIQIERSHLLTKYDNHWHDADELEREIVRIKRTNSPEEDDTLNQLDKKLKDQYRDLHQIELDIQQLDKALK